MTIQVTIKNDDSRANAVVEVLSVSEYKSCVGGITSTLPPTSRTTTSEGLLRGGESKTVYLTSNRKLEIIERQNG